MSKLILILLITLMSVFFGPVNKKTKTLDKNYSSIKDVSNTSFRKITKNEGLVNSHTTINPNKY